MKYHQKHNLYSILTLLTLISLSFSATVINYGSTSFSDTYTSDQKTVYNIKMTNPIAGGYLQVAVKGDKPLVTHIVDFAKSENSDDRVQLSTSATSKTIMWLTKDQLGTSDNFLTVQCSEYPCDYELSLNTFSNIEIFYGHQYTYYVTEKNKVMNFYFSFEYGGTPDDSTVTIWASGAKKVVTSINDGEASYGKSESGQVFTMKANSVPEKLKVSITGEVGDLINVGGYSIIDEISETEIEINAPQIKGLIQKGKNDHACYKLAKNTDYSFKAGDCLYFTGTFQNGIAEIYFADETGSEIDGGQYLYTSGYVNFRLDFSSYYDNMICVRFPSENPENYDLTEIQYEFQLVYTKELTLKTPIYAPQNLGQIYPRVLHSAETIVYIGMPAPDDAKEEKYAMSTIVGFPDMFFGTCEDYPICLYDKEKIKETKDPHNINSMSAYSVKLTEKTSVISPKQNVLIVNCTEGGSKSKSEKQDVSELNKNICEFNTMIFTNLDYVRLVENHMFNQYIMDGESDHYEISYKGLLNVQKIYVDLMIFTGDVTFQLSDKIDAHKYQTANKIFYSITIDPDNQDKVLQFTVQAKGNSFYSIQYTLVKKDDDSWMVNSIPSGVNYLLTIEPLATDKEGGIALKKIFNFSNLRMADGHPFLVNFYSLNCKLLIYKLHRESEKDEGEEIMLESKNYYYTQDIMKKEDKANYYNKEYTYIARVLAMEQGPYNKKLCMLYSSSLELEQPGRSVERQILVSDNVPQQVIFEEGYDNIKYLFVLPSIDKDAAIRFKLYDKASYVAKVYVDRHQIGDDHIVNSDQQIFIYKMFFEQHCPKDQPCALVLEITCEGSYIERNPYLELEIKSIGDDYIFPAYIIKNKVSLDYLNGNKWQYFYTDLAKSQSGDIIVNFHRGCGMIYARIVQKNQKIPDSEPQWRGMFSFPKTIETSLPYTSYLKKVSFTEKDTANCEDGCYLLISIQTSVQSAFEHTERQFSFNILVNAVLPEDIVEVAPLTNIPLEDYIIGNVAASMEEEIKTYYLAEFPHDASQVEIDFQSSVSTLYINIGADSERPTVRRSDIVLKPTMRTNLYVIPKDDIIKIAKARNLIDPDDDVQSLKGLSMIIGVYEDITDSIFETVYALKVHLPIQQNLNIYEIYSDQENLCNTTAVDGKYRCLYMVLYDDIDTIYNLLLYPIFSDQTVEYEIDADFITAEKYELYDTEYMESKIPTSSANFSTLKTKYDYLFVQLMGHSDHYLFVSVITNKPTVVGMLSTYSTYDNGLSPNPSTRQLYIIERQSMNFTFAAKDDLMVDLVSLKGDADIYWDDNDKQQYPLRGRDDRLSITSIGKTTGKLRSLFIKNLHPSASLITDSPEGFAFYLNFYRRSSEINFDELTIGKSYNFAYQDTKFPIAIYTRIENQQKDLNAYVTFYELLNNDGKSDLEHKFIIRATIYKEATISDAKQKKELTPINSNTVTGRCDPSIRTCLVGLKKADIARFKISDENKPILVILITKVDDNLDSRYKSISMEATVTQDDSLVPVTEKVYQHGKLKLDSEKIVYKLRTDRLQPIMRIVFSSNSEHIDYAVNTKEGVLTNDTSLSPEVKQSGGRELFTFKSNPEKNSFIYLTVFHKKNKKAENEKLTNYIFKYINSNSTERIFDYKPLSSKLEYTKKDKEYKIKVSPISGAKNKKVTHLVKLVERNDLLKENFNSIAVTESNAFVNEYSSNSESTAEYTFKDVEADIAYIQVIAHINDGPINEFVAYQSIYIEKKGTGFVFSDTQIVIFIIIGVVLLIAVIVLIIVLVQFNAKNKDLLQKVNQTSFQAEREGEERDTNGDGLLLKEDGGLS